MIKMVQSNKGGKIIRICGSCGKGLTNFELECSFKEESEDTLDRWFE
jgi:hypothetical protein